MVLAGFSPDRSSSALPRRDTDDDAEASSEEDADLSAEDKALLGEASAILREAHAALLEAGLDVGHKSQKLDARHEARPTAATQAVAASLGELTPGLKRPRNPSLAENTPEKSSRVAVGEECSRSGWDDSNSQSNKGDSHLEVCGKITPMGLPTKIALLAAEATCTNPDQADGKNLQGCKPGYILN